ncbi:unnamed protein product [Allacma fusca]|uniref:Uncharacterized protein n=1 Tax=Allacma fusca TaxID=39272 RepID=A0A8J2PW98_9HEXA|nr:unnamed protein product [Allacma fusca]
MVLLTVFGQPLILFRLRGELVFITPTSLSVLTQLMCRFCKYFMEASCSIIAVSMYCQSSTIVFKPKFCQTCSLLVKNP